MSEDINNQNAFLTEKQVCRLLNLNLASLRRWRLRKENLPFVKMGKHVRYRYDDINKFINQNFIKNK